MITIDMTQALADLNAIRARMADMQPALTRIGETQTEAIQARITTLKTSPDGEEWAPWSARRLEERTKKGNTGQGLLWDTGTLLHSIRMQADANSVAIGTDVPYAAELQNGRHMEMEARPFVGWVDDRLPLVEQMVAHYVEFGVLA